MNTDFDPRPLRDEPLAIDLLNTKMAGRDLLDDPPLVEAWLRAVDHPDVYPTAEQIDSLRHTRAVTEALFLSASNPDVKEISKSELIAINALLANGTPRANLDLSITYVASNPWQLPLLVIVDALELARARAQRLRQCHHENCILWFCDTSKGGRRRWCSMERCGNRKKAERNYRKKAQPDP